MKHDEYQDVYRVMVKDRDFKIHYKRFTSEEEARAFYYSITNAEARVRELDLIHQCKYITLEWELL